MRRKSTLLSGIATLILSTACGQQKPLPQGFSAEKAIPSTLSQPTPGPVGPSPKSRNRPPTVNPEVSVTTTTLSVTTTTISIATTTTTTATTATTTTTTTTTAPQAVQQKANPEAPKVDSQQEDQQPGVALLPGMIESDFEKKGDAIPTVYYKARYELAKQTCEPSQKLPILNPEDEVLVELCPRAHADCTLQGSCMIVDEDGLSTSINYVRNLNKIPRFVEIDSQRCPFGLGVQNMCLDPFYTVAADLDFFRAGDVLFVPALVGLDLPRGVKHHGFLVVRDRGGGIKGDHRFDFFSGFFHYTDARNPFSQVGLQDQKNRFPYYKVNGKSAELILKKRGFPELPSVKR